MERHIRAPFVRPPLALALAATATAIAAFAADRSRVHEDTQFPTTGVAEIVSTATGRIASFRASPDVPPMSPVQSRDHQPLGEILAFDGATVSLVSDDNELVLSMTPSPEGTWRAGSDSRYSLRDAVLTSQYEAHGVNDLRAQYRLHFTIDVCEHEQPITSDMPSSWWSPCRYVVGRPRPTWIMPFDLLIERKFSRSPATPQYGPTYLDMLDAACVPATGAGPSCQLSGSRAQLSDGTRTINGG
jgi:hypothetical protein